LQSSSGRSGGGGGKRKSYPSVKDFFSKRSCTQGDGGSKPGGSGTQPGDSGSKLDGGSENQLGGSGGQPGGSGGQPGGSGIQLGGSGSQFGESATQCGGGSVRRGGGSSSLFGNLSGGAGVDNDKSPSSSLSNLPVLMPGIPQSSSSCDAAVQPRGSDVLSQSQGGSSSSGSHIQNIGKYMGSSARPDGAVAAALLENHWRPPQNYDFPFLLIGKTKGQKRKKDMCGGNTLRNTPG